MRIKKALLALTLIVFILCGCEKHEVCQTGEYWQIIKNTTNSSITYNCTIFDTEGNVLLERKISSEPQISFYRYYVRIYTADAAECTIQYVNVFDGIVSDVFKNPLAWSEFYVAEPVQNQSGKWEIAVNNGFTGETIRSFELAIADNLPPEETIIGAAFDEYAENLTVIYISSEDNMHRTAVFPITLLNWENNPIDRFYNTFTVEAYDTISEQTEAFIYREAWLTEFNNALQMLSGMANPKIDSIQNDIDAIRENFAQYAESYSSLYAVYDWSDGFFSDGNELKDKITYGSGATAASLYCEAELYRQATLDLYRMMNDRFSDVDDAFVFDAQEHLARLSEAGISVSIK